MALAWVSPGFAEPYSSPEDTSECAFQVTLEQQTNSLISGAGSNLLCIQEKIEEICTNLGNQPTCDYNLLRQSGGTNDPDMDWAIIHWMEATYGCNFDPSQWYVQSTCTLAMDSNCQPVPYLPSTICGSFDYVTPISLVVSGSPYDLSDVTSYSSFPLSPNSQGVTEWKASSRTPLLVYDDGSGPINSPEKLFGPFAFGKSWEDGFAALSSLDKNQDGAVNGAEFANLKLWFDNNQDGVADAGEIKSLDEVGVTALYTTPDSDRSRGLIASHGFDQTVDGATVKKPSVDWTAKQYDSISSLLPSVVNSNLRPGFSRANSVGQSNGELNQASMGAKQLMGLWLSEIVENNSIKGAKSLIAFDTSSNEPHGMAVTEMPVKKGPGNVKSLVGSYAIKDITVSDNNDISFRTQLPSGKWIASSGKLGRNGLQMTGTSSVEDENGRVIKYHFKAAKFVDQRK